jgi:hypothetical protein
MNDNAAIKFVKDVIAGTRTLADQEVKSLSGDPNPEWFCGYNGVQVKMHTGVRRETLSGVKFVDKDGERSFFNLGMAQALKGGVGPAKAINEHKYAFAQWTIGLTWTEAKDFLKKILENSLAKTPNRKKS